MDDIERFGFWKEEVNKEFTSDDLRACFLAARLKLKNENFFEDFSSFFIWYKEIRNYEKVLQVQKKLSSVSIPKE
jgi:hypothetical protein